MALAVSFYPKLFVCLYKYLRFYIQRWEPSVFIFNKSKSKLKFFHSSNETIQIIVCDHTVTSHWHPIWHVTATNNRPVSMYRYFFFYLLLVGCSSSHFVCMWRHFGKHSAAYAYIETWHPALCGCGLLCLNDHIIHLVIEASAKQQ